MPASTRVFLATVVAAFGLLFVGSNASQAQQRYQPSTPTVSPYLNLFQNNRNGSFNRALPNYYTLVRPQLQQNRINAQQQQLLQEQDTTIQDLQQNVQILQQQPGPTVVTGHNSWFQNTGRYFAQVGVGAGGALSSRPTGTAAHVAAPSGTSSRGRTR